MTILQNTQNLYDRTVNLRGDRVIGLLALLMTSLFLADWGQAIESLRFVGASVLQIAPFFTAAVGFAAFAKASGIDRLIARAFSGAPFVAVMAGSLAGALSPFCSCGVIPLIAAMLASGVPLAPVMAFCIASPIMDPEMFILTAAGISMEFAVAKTLTAVAMGLLSGIAVLALQKSGYLLQSLKPKADTGCGRTAFDPLAPVDIDMRFWKDPAKRTVFWDQARTNGFFLGKWMALAFFIESLMIAYLPADAIAALVGSENALAIPLAALVGIPAYMNGYAAIPMISGLLTLGMSPGAALSFTTAGAVSSIPAALAVYALVRRPIFVLYLGLGTFGAIGAGYLYQLITTI